MTTIYLTELVLGSTLEHDKKIVEGVCIKVPGGWASQIWPSFDLAKS